MSSLSKLKTLSIKAVDASREYDDYRLDLAYTESESYFDISAKYEKKMTEKFISSKLDMDKKLLAARKKLNLLKANRDLAISMYNNYKLFLTTKGVVSD